MTQLTREYINSEKKHFVIGSNLPLILTAEGFLQDALNDGTTTKKNVAYADDVINVVIFVLAVNDNIGTSIIVPAAIAENLLWNDDNDPSSFIPVETLLDMLKNGDNKTLGDLMEYASERIADATVA